MMIQSTVMENSLHGFLATQKKEEIEDGFKKIYQDSTAQKEEIFTSTNSSVSETDSPTKAMLDDLLSKGTLRFLQELNQEKIEKLIEEKEKELKAQYSSEDLNDPKIAAKIDKELALYRKELLEKIAKSDDSKEKISVYDLQDLLALNLK